MKFILRVLQTAHFYSSIQNTDQQENYQKILAFFKSIINLSWCDKGGVQGFFYYSKGSLILTSKIFDWSEDETNEFSK